MPLHAARRAPFAVPTAATVMAEITADSCRTRCVRPLPQQGVREHASTAARHGARFHAAPRHSAHIEPAMIIYYDSAFAAHASAAFSRCVPPAGRPRHVTRRPGRSRIGLQLPKRQPSAGIFIRRWRRRSFGLGVIGRHSAWYIIARRALAAHA